jgi:hypothetical protein
MKKITLTDEQASTLSVFLLVTTKFREGEIEACRSLAKEKNEDGSPKLPNMASNAEWWEATHKEIENIIKAVDGGVTE